MSPHRDLLAELELTMVPSPRFRPEPGMYEPAGTARGRSCRRSFWCALKNQEVEVEFETRSVLGFPCVVGLRGCSVFDDPEHVVCGRHCLDSKYRRQWPFALPILDRRRAPGD